MTELDLNHDLTVGQDKDCCPEHVEDTLRLPDMETSDQSKPPRDSQSAKKAEKKK